MAGPDPLSLEQRVARLERLVARLLERTQEPGGDRARVTREAAIDAGDPRTATRGSTGRAGAATRERAASRGLSDLGERWLGRVGVAFVILAFGFLFRYAFDQGWIGPGFRLVLGIFAATAMLAVGLRLEGSRERYSQYLLGGAIAVYYLVGFASYELYALVPFAIAFAFMCAVTVLAFALAERQRLPSLAVIGAGGGLATPFLVNTGSGNVPALVAYTTLLLAGAGALQFLRGWRSLLFVLGLGGLTVMALAVAMASGASDILEAGITTLGVLTAGALLAVFPLFRTHLRQTDPEGWEEPPLPDWMGQIASTDRIALTLLRVGCYVGAFFGVLELGLIFEVEISTLGLLYLVAVAGYLALARGFFDTRSALHASAETASILLMVGIAFLLRDYRVMLPLAVAGAAMHSAHARWSLPGVAILAHVLFAQLLLLLVGRLEVLGVSAGSPFGVREIGALGAIVLAFTTTFVFASATTRTAYRIAAHVAFMAWLATQFGPMERGQELISLSWGVYGITLFLISLRLGDRGVQLGGLATLGVVAAKLLLVDMAQVDVIWRILLFMGFGAAFLGLSYLVNREAEPG